MRSLRERKGTQKQGKGDSSNTNEDDKATISTHQEKDQASKRNLEQKYSVNSSGNENSTSKNIEITTEQPSQDTVMSAPNTKNLSNATMPPTMQSPAPVREQRASSSNKAGTTPPIGSLSPPIGNIVVKGMDYMHTPPQREETSRIELTPRKQISRPMRPGGMVPVLFIIALITYLFTTYLFLHIGPLLRSPDSSTTGGIRARVFIGGTALLVCSFIMGIITDPGRVPDEWRIRVMKQFEVANKVRDKKKDGDFRNCKWCSVYKPDRTHHCSVMGRCVVKMDHHCPWLYNTVGFYNYKYFYLLLLYSALVCWTIVFTMWETVLQHKREGVKDFWESFQVLFCWTLSFLVASVVTLFLSFHTWLISRNLTTIEFCEAFTADQIRGKFGIMGSVGMFFLGKGSDSKKDPVSKDVSPKSEAGTLVGKNAGDRQKGVVLNDSVDTKSKFDQGLYYNFCCVLGSNPLLWLLPFIGPSGDGLVWMDKRSTFLDSSDPQPSFVFVDDSDDDVPIAVGTVVTVGKVDNQ